MNIDPQAGKFWFTVAIGIILLTIVVFFFVEPGTSAYYINIFSLIAGVILLALVIYLVRKANK